jgi:hypothetical protein
MAKIRKYTLSWDASASTTVIGYKLYWSKGTAVSYDSKFIKVGNVTTIALPDDVTLSDGPVMFGVTAIDRDGNESDMATIAEPYQMQVPQAPGGVAFKPSDEFKLIDAARPQLRNVKVVDNGAVPQSDNEDPLAEAIEGSDSDPGQPSRGKYYDDVGYRQTT